MPKDPVSVIKKETKCHNGQSQEQYECHTLAQNLRIFVTDVCESSMSKRGHVHGSGLSAHLESPSAV